MTQNERILRHMRDCGYISSMDAFVNYGVTRLSARISDLRRAGYKIRSDRRTFHNRYGDKVSFCLYWLEEELG